MRTHADLLDIRPEIAAALADGRPVVALESTLIAHGLPWPKNLETARAAEASIRAGGAVPATIAVLGAAFLFALGSAALVGYLLSRQLVRRLERLGGAVEALAAGDLNQRVDEGRDDEVGQLARRFNTMADRLASTVAELDARTREAESALGLRIARLDRLAREQRRLRAERDKELAELRAKSRHWWSRSS